ncbi:hypothetical protein ANO11243_083930 [Dothideomycetidae sp. 11243]|nr:hypothetical protein ANO11243_083930 [fungal sp. No.11243]
MAVADPHLLNRSSLLHRLPSEILYHIFSYLLLARNVRNTVSVLLKGPHYRFETSILRVDRAIGKQAQIYLYTTNSFVSIRYQDDTPLGDFLKKLKPMPIVSYKYLDKFRAHDISIEMFLMETDSDDEDSDEDAEETDGPGDSSHPPPSTEASRPAQAHGNSKKAKRDCKCADCDPDTVFHRILITHQHLSSFCAVYQLCNHSSTGGHAVVESGNSSHWHQPQPSQVAFTRVVLLRLPLQLSGLGKKSEIQKQAQLLEPFQKICGGGHIYRYHVFGTGKIVNSKVLLELRDKGFCYAVSKDGMGWDLLKHLRYLKRLLDACTTKGPSRTGFEQLAKAYSALGNRAFENTLTYMGLTAIPEEDEKAMHSWQLGLTCLRIDCLLTAAQCQLKAGNDHSAWHSIRDAYSHTEPDLLGKFPSFNSSVAVLLHFHAVCMNHIDDDIYFSEPGDVRDELVKASRLHPANKRIRKDLRFWDRNADEPLDFDNSTVRLYPLVHHTETDIIIPDIPRVWRGTEEMLSDETIDMLESGHGIVRGGDQSSTDDELDDSDESMEDDEDEDDDHGSDEERDREAKFWKGCDTDLPLDGFVADDQATIHDFFPTIKA